ncbi:hypothetical protein SAMN05421821_12130 [Mucilaginibacter lappiensis]|uniref:YdhG-like domain-containing protein n=1 Tax=Mucilaginibacter lappiensis TaxID=354630 RepID=A0ABR6PSE8_9SPHI|nr:DUF1801 domain-containing protein [Mucilaginibacter lappiensis]MBB6112712.1 hypothetical protein [Mucilaginibacter lappiensis]SIS05812.1 hypothetical protein SAMN05421821_12130 [Mucilaginibacter lappiensis]
MAKEEKTDLLKFLTPFRTDVQERALWLRDFVWDLFPQANELIYDNYNALAFGWSPTEKVGHAFCSIAVFRTNNNLQFGFYHGADLTDPEKMLIGNGKQYRYITVPDIKEFPVIYIKQLLLEAWINSLKLVKDPKQMVQGKTITKSISAKQRGK